jgi:hypothetical protein
VNATHWADPASAARADYGRKVVQFPQRGLGADAVYRQWRLSAGAARQYSMDADQIEYRFIGGQVVPVGVLELTQIDSWEVPESYLRAIRNRYLHRDAQGKVAKAVAAALGCQAFIIGYHPTCARFWIYNLTKPQGWTVCGAETYGTFLQRLPFGKG